MVLFAQVKLAEKLGESEGNGIKGCLTNNQGGEDCAWKVGWMGRQ
jgi:hypothetical protein